MVAQGLQPFFLIDTTLQDWLELRLMIKYDFST